MAERKKDRSRSSLEKIDKKSSPKRLYRSKEDKVIAGVCGGLGEYLDVDPVWIRLVAVLLVFANGIGVLAYLIAWILVPENPCQKTVGKKAAVTVEKNQVKGRGSVSIIFGIIITYIGLGFLLRNLIGSFDFNYVWALSIISIGIYLVWRRR